MTREVLKSKDAPAHREKDAAQLTLFVLTIFCGASLLFLVQPLFARMVLPYLGGAPAVWSTAMLFFQGALLAGYVWVHFLTSRCGLRMQVGLQLSLVLLAFLILPIRPPEGASVPEVSNPILWLLGLLVVAVGLPFLAVSTTSPLVQRWFSRSGNSHATDPYFLYAASNVGSMLALLAYPLVIEPNLPLATQSQVWSFGYLGLVCLIAACGALMLRAKPYQAQAVLAQGASATVVARTKSASVEESRRLSAPTVGRRVRWVLLAAVPVSFMMAVTTYLSVDIAPVPLLWVVPLAVYLLTFIIAFSKRALPLRVLAAVFPYLALPMVLQLSSNSLQPGLGPAGVLILTHLVTLALVGLLCHGQLAADRPDTTHLTEFYLWLALGGVVGGIFNALVAPLVFTNVYEYPIALVAAAFLAPKLERVVDTKRRRILDWLLPAVLGVIVVVFALLARSGLISREVAIVFAVGLPTLIAFSFSRRPRRFALGIGAILLASTLLFGESANTLHVERSFFGVHRVTYNAQTDRRNMYHGSTLHGIQHQQEERKLMTTTYYHTTGPNAQALAAARAARSEQVTHTTSLFTQEPLRVAVIGLGGGTMACLGARGEKWDFYEIDPAVERIARTYFTFLKDCPPTSRVILGDGRLKLAQAHGLYDAIALDAFSSDAIPVHLLTREAIALYFQKLTPTGVVVFHISNRHLDLEPVLARIAEEGGYVSVVREDLAISSREVEEGKSSSKVLVMGRTQSDLSYLPSRPGWEKASTKLGVAAWTDDYSSIFAIFKRD